MWSFILWMSLTPACQASLDYSDVIEEDSKPKHQEGKAHSYVAPLVLLSHPDAFSFLSPLGVGLGEKEEGQMSRSISSDCPFQNLGAWVLVPCLSQFKASFPSLNSCSICCHHVLYFNLPKDTISYLRVRSCLIFLFIPYQHLYVVGNEHLLIAFFGVTCKSPWSPSMGTQPSFAVLLLMI